MPMQGRLAKWRVSRNCRLAHNPLSDASVAKLSKLSNLKSIDLQGTNIAPSQFAAIRVPVSEEEAGHGSIDGP